jgi:1-Cys peroxiredoxin 6
VVTPAVKTEDAQDRFQNLEVADLPSGKQYLRYVDCPTQSAGISS